MALRRHIRRAGWIERADLGQPATLSANRYDRRSGTLRFTAPEAASYRRQVDQWRTYFGGFSASRGLSAKTITDPEELRELVAFFAWTAWGAAARMPGKSYSYTQNFPYEPLLHNGPSGEAVLWSALSLIVHLRVEAFVELFVTVMVATLFYKLGLVARHSPTSRSSSPWTGRECLPTWSSSCSEWCRS